jgi:hypothetical protein
MVRQAKDDAIARDNIATGGGIGDAVGSEMLVSAFVLCVYYARAEQRKDAYERKKSATAPEKQEAREVKSNTHR